MYETIKVLHIYKVSYIYTICEHDFPHLITRKLYEFSILREYIHEFSQQCHKIKKFPKSRAGGINERAVGRGL